MKIHEFVKDIAVRFDNKLKTDEQRNAFFNDCKIHLRKFEGDILGYAFHEIVYQRKFASHPKIAEIVKVCNDKMHTDHKKTNPVSKEQARWQVNMKMVREFKETESFEWAALRMIGQDVLLYIERNGKTPDQAEVNKMLNAHEIFKKNMVAAENDMDLSPLRLALYKTGKALNERNLDYYHQFN